MNILTHVSKMWCCTPISCPKLTTIWENSHYLTTFPPVDSIPACVFHVPNCCTLLLCTAEEEFSNSEPDKGIHRHRQWFLKHLRSLQVERLSCYTRCYCMINIERKREDFRHWFFLCFTYNLILPIITLP